MYNHNMIALQLYSLRDDAKKNLSSTLKAVRKIGYESIELAGLHGHSPKDVRKMLDDLGLKVCGAHIGIDRFNDDQFNAMIDECKVLGCLRAIIPWLPENLRNSREATLKTCERFSQLSEKLRKHGMQTGFHLHAADVKPIDGNDGVGQSAWQIIADHTPADFIMQHDTANALAGGSTATWTLERYPTRCTTVHFKEHPGDGSVIGEGVVPWKRVIELCKQARSDAWIVEHEVYTKYPPIESVRRAYENLKAMI